MSLNIASIASGLNGKPPVAEVFCRASIVVTIFCKLFKFALANCGTIVLSSGNKSVIFLSVFAVSTLNDKPLPPPLLLLFKKFSLPKPKPDLERLLNLLFVKLSRNCSSLSLSDFILRSKLA